MTIASFHQQVQLGGRDPLLEKLSLLRNAESLRALLDDPGDRPLYIWPFWT